MWLCYHLHKSRRLCTSLSFCMNVRLPFSSSMNAWLAKNLLWIFIKFLEGVRIVTRNSHFAADPDLGCMHFARMFVNIVVLYLPSAVYEWCMFELCGCSLVNNVCHSCILWEKWRSVLSSNVLHCCFWIICKSILFALSYQFRFWFVLQIRNQIFEV